MMTGTTSNPINLLDLPDDILGIIFEKRREIMRKEKLRYVKACLGWRSGGYWGDNNLFDNWVKNLREKGKDDEEIKNDFFYFKAIETPNFDDYEKNIFYKVIEDKKDDGTTDISVYHDFTKLNLEQLDIIHKVDDFYTQLFDLVWERDDGDDFNDYRVSYYEDINPYQTIIDNLSEITITNNATYDEQQVDLRGVVDMDKLEEKRDEWAIDVFNEDEEKNLFEPFIKYLWEFLSDEYGTEKTGMRVDMEDAIIKIIEEDAEDDIHEISEERFSMCLWIYLKDFFDDPFEILDKLKNYY